MKRHRNIGISFAIVAAGLLSGYWISQLYGNPNVTGLLSEGRTTLQVVRQVGGGGGSAVQMPFFDYRKGP